MKVLCILLCAAMSTVAQARVLPRTLVVAQSQMYPLRERSGGYLGRYVDQPLCLDPGLSPEAPYGTRIGQADFERQQREILDYGADGFAFFSGRKGAIAAGAASSVSNAVTLRVICAWDRIEDDIEAFREAAENPRGCSHGGRNVILGYWTQHYNTPEQLAAKLAVVRAAVGDKFLYVAEIDCDSAMRNRRGHSAEAYAAMQEAFRENCRRFLRVADGIYVSEVILMRQPEAATLCWRHDAELYRTLVRIARETIDEPEFRGRKLLAVDVINGHENAYTRGYTTPHDGTRTLRETMRIAVEADADIIKFSEWDEWNENTCFCPTLCNSYSTKRIVRHFIRGMRGEPPAPLPGDDTSVPNLIVTHRKCLSPGEMLYVEVLNVPDGSPRADIFCTVSLTDEHGAVVRAFPEVRLHSGLLEEKRLTVDSATLSPARALNVRLLWRTSDGRSGSIDEGFHPIDLAPGNAWNHKAVKQPLRDLARMTRASVKLAGNVISADVACEDPIRYVMACGNGDILRIHGRPGAPDRFVEDASNAVFMLSGSKWKQISRSQDFFRTAHCAVPGVPEAEWRLGAGVTSQTGTTFQITCIGPRAEPLFLRVPKAKLADARLAIDLPRTIVGEIPLSAAFSHGAYSIGAADSVQVTAARLDRQAFYPFPLDAKCCAFSDAFVPNSRSTVYFLQVVTMSGKTWRSRPFVREESDGTFALFRVPSVADGVQDVVLPAVRVPCLEYDFSPAAGCVMRVQNGDRRWFGMSGGPFVQSLLRNRGPSIADVIDRRQSPEYAARAVDSHPRRERQPDGSWAFVFDGTDDYIGFPWETIPQFGSWRLSFEIRPDRIDSREVVYAARFTESNGSLWGVYNDRGRILAGYAGFPDRSEWVDVRSPVALSTNAWNSVVVAHDGKRLSVSVNGAPPVFKDCLLPGKSTSTTILGGFPRREKFFKGRIRRLKVDHAMKRGLAPGAPFHASED